MVHRNSEGNKAGMEGDRSKDCNYESTGGCRCLHRALENGQFCFFHHPWHLMCQEEQKERAKKSSVSTTDDLSHSYRRLCWVDLDHLITLTDYLVRRQTGLEI